MAIESKINHAIKQLIQAFVNKDIEKLNNFNYRPTILQNFFVEVKEK